MLFSTHLNKTGLSCKASILWHNMDEISGESPVRVLHSSTISDSAESRDIDTHEVTNIT
jgi:hypothetical protein